MAGDCEPQGRRLADTMTDASRDDESTWPTIKHVSRKLRVRAYCDDLESGVTVTARKTIVLEQFQCRDFVRRVEGCQFFPTNADGLRRALGRLDLHATASLQWVSPSLWRATGFQDATGLALPELEQHSGHLEYKVYFDFEPNLLIVEDSKIVGKPDRRRKKQAVWLQDEPDAVELWNDPIDRMLELAGADAKRKSLMEFRINETPADLRVERSASRSILTSRES